MKTERVKLIGKSIFFLQEKLLAIADLHIGHEEAMNKEGIFLPRMQFSETISDLKKIIKKAGKINEIVICGDLKHEFAIISKQEWQETYKLIEFLKQHCEKIILVKGNHDKILGRISELIEVRDFYIKNEICFMHGDKNLLFGKKQNTFIKDKEIKTIVMGHRHPAVVISDKYKKEKYKCFLVGKWKGKEIIILPSFFPLVEGTDIINSWENNLLFILEKDLRNFSVYAVSDSEVLNFGKMGKLEKRGIERDI